MFKNFDWGVSLDGERCIEIYQLKPDGSVESVIIDITQHAAMVKAIGLCADEIYQKRKPEEA